MRRLQGTQLLRFQPANGAMDAARTAGRVVRAVQATAQQNAAAAFNAYELLPIILYAFNLIPPVRRGI